MKERTTMAGSPRTLRSVSLRTVFVLTVCFNQAIERQLVRERG